MLTTKTWHSRYNLDYRLKTMYRRKVTAFQKKNPSITPFCVTSKVLAENWWGKAFNAHLKNYTKNTIHLEKGKLHFRCEALADMKITDGHIKAIVFGTAIQPYDVSITINPLPKENWARIQKIYDGNLEGFEKILDKQFPKNMAGIFTNKPSGLFPLMKDISFECSCSDHGRICKHVGVALYALGAKIDADPLLLFTLRGADLMKFISDSIHKERKEILKRANNKSFKVLKTKDLSEIFSLIDLK